MSDAVQRLISSMRLSSGETRNKVGTQGTGLQQVREFNRLLVLNCVREHGPISRVEIHRRTGLSRTTVSSIMDTLLQDKLVREGSFSNAAPEGGRRPILVHFNAEAGYILGIDVGRTHLTLLLTDLATSKVADHSGPFDLERGPRICLPLLVAEVRVFVEETGLAWEQILGIGMGIPGPLDAELHKLSGPPSMPGWDGVDVWEVFANEFPDIPFYMDNDANMGALGENHYGAGRGESSMAYIKIGTGIGAGLIVNGHIYRGRNGSAGEIGHMIIAENGPLCSCGSSGCLEALAGAPAIVEDARTGRSLWQARSLPVAKELGEPKPAPTLALEQSPEPVPTMPPALATRAIADIADVIEAAQQGDGASIAALEHAGARIGTALAGLVNLFNPSSIILDGGTSRAGDFLIAPLYQTTAASSLRAAWQGTRILPGELEQTAIALGAVFTVIEAAFYPTTSTIQPVETGSIPQTFYRSHAQ